MCRALILDCDGVLVDAEQTGHLRAFNEMWRRLDVPWQWAPAEYVSKLSISGGRERLASLRDDARFRSAVSVPNDDDDWLGLVGHWHRLKTDIYMDLVRRGELEVRVGVRRLAQEAVDSGWGLAVASSGARRSVELVVGHALGDRLAAAAVIVTGECVKAKKPAPDIYLRAASLLGAEASECLVVEDTEVGLTAALNAGMTCVVTLTRHSGGKRFDGAAAVLSALGPTSRAPMRVIANDAMLPLGTEFGLSSVSARPSSTGAPSTARSSQPAPTPTASAASAHAPENLFDGSEPSLP
ncbi:HAD-IA family hydrolase [Streptomyces sp.]|uniref:HAD-IA family hydrolase n=1 Tax=Streptomyces sp. TaxID=1931 RepID=UPI0039C9B9B3